MFFNLYVFGPLSWVVLSGLKDLRLICHVDALFCLACPCSLGLTGFIAHRTRRCCDRHREGKIGEYVNLVHACVGPQQPRIGGPGRLTH